MFTELANSRIVANSDITPISGSALVAVADQCGLLSKRKGRLGQQVGTINGFPTCTLEGQSAQNFLRSKRTTVELRMRQSVRCQPPEASEEPMDHAFPYVHACIDSRDDCAFYEADRVVEQHFVVAHMHTDRREASQVGMEWRSKWIGCIVTVEIRPHQFGGLRLCEVRVGHRACPPASTSEREVCHGRKRDTADDRALGRGAALQEGEQTKS